MGVEDEEDIDATTGEVSTPYQATPAAEQAQYIAESNPEAPF
jgi:hypothetical protein